jgi:L-fuconolactonase
MNIVDAHHHLWDPADRSYPWLDAAPLAAIRRPYRLDDLRRNAERAGVRHTVLVQTVPEVAETRDFLAVARESAGLVAGVVGWVDLTNPAVAQTLDELRAVPGGEHLVGIRHQVQDEAEPRWLLRPDVVRGLRAVAAAGLAYDLLVLPHQLPDAIAAVERVPEGRFVLDHAGKPPIRSSDVEPWATHLHQLARQDNVDCKLSGLVTEADWDGWEVAHLRPFAEVVLAAFGPGRVIAGSDWPVCELAATYEQVWDVTAQLVSALNAGERQDVLAGAAARCYRLVLRWPRAQP